MVSILKKFQDMLGNSPEKEAAQKLYIASVTQARNPFFYLDAGVPDTLDDKNVYGSAAPSVEKIHVLENYIKKLLVHLEAATVSELREGKLSFDGILKKEHY